MRKWLGIPDTNPPAGKPDILTNAGAEMELPRIKVMGTRGMAALTEAGPPTGMFVVNYDTGRLNQWVGDHWEVVAQHVIGQAPYSDDASRDKNAPGLGFLAALGVANGGQGGGGVSPAPRGPNDGSITEAVSGGSPAAIYSGAGGNDVNSHSVTGTPFTDNLGPPFTIPNAGPGVATSRVRVQISIFFPTPINVGDCLIEVLADGVVIFSDVNVSGNAQLLTGATTNPVVGDSIQFSYRVSKTSGGVANFAFQYATTDIILFEILYA